MAILRSEYSKKKKAGKLEFLPEVEMWTKVCQTAAYDTQIYKSFSICKDTFYSFLDRERCKEEQDPLYKSAYLAAYINKRHETRQLISDAFLENIIKGDTASILFGMKTYNGLIEAKDIKHIELKKKEVALKTKMFLTDLANKFNLNFEELKEFANQHFKDIKLDA